jgi:hypothetical protein
MTDDPRKTRERIETLLRKALTHDSAQQEPSAAPPRVRARLNQSLKALIAFESVPLGGVGLSGDGPRGAGSPGRSRAGRAPAGGQPGGTSGARRAAEKPWRGGGAGELLGGTGGWAAGGQRRRGRVGRREKWLYFSYTSRSCYPLLSATGGILFLWGVLALF